MAAFSKEQGNLSDRVLRTDALFVRRDNPCRSLIMRTRNALTIVLAIAMLAVTVALPQTAQAGTVELTDSGQLDLTAREVLAAVNFYDTDRMGPQNGHSLVGVIQGVDFDDFMSNVDDTGLPFTMVSPNVRAGGTLSTEIPQDDGREFNGGSGDPTLLGLSGPDATELQLLAHGGPFWQGNQSSTLTFAFAGITEPTAVEVQMIGGWGAIDTGVFTVEVDSTVMGAIDVAALPKLPQLLTFETMTDEFGGLAIDVSVNNRSCILSGMTVTLAPTELVWAGGVADNWNDANWQPDGVGDPTSPNGAVVAEEMIVNSGTVNVTDTPNAADSMAIGGTGIVNVNGSGNLSIIRDVSVNSGGSLIVDGALTVGRAMTVDGTFTTNGTGTIPVVDVNTGGVLNIASSAITNLNVVGGTVNTIGAAAVGHLQIDSGQLNLTGGNLAVPTVTIISGGIDPSAGALVVSDTASFGTPAALGTLTITAGASPFELSGADTDRTVTLTGDTVTLTDGRGTASPPVTATASNELNAGWTVDGIVNGDGLDGDLHNTNASDNWLTGNLLIDDQWVLFDLGAVHTISSFKVWNYSESTADYSLNRGVNGVTVEYGNDEDTDVGSFEMNFERAPAESPFPGVEYDPDGAGTTFNAQFVKFNINSGYSGVPTSYVGLAEVRFNGFVSSHPIFDASDTSILASETSTLEILEAQGELKLGGIEVAATKTLTIASPSANIQLTNLNIGGGSLVRSTQAASVSSIDIAVSGKLTIEGDGQSYLGDLAGDGDDNSTNLTLGDGAVIDWVFGSVGADNDSYLTIKGLTTLGASLTVNIVDGGGSADSDDVYLLRSLGGVVNPTAALLGDKPEGWTGTLEWVQKGPSLWDLQLTGLTTSGQNAGDTNGDGFVDDTDMANFELAFGLAGAELIAKEFAFDPDFDDDGDADLDDFVALRESFGNNYNLAPSMPDLSQTPEPATMSLLALGALAILRRRRRK